MSHKVDIFSRSEKPESGSAHTIQINKNLLFKFSLKRLHFKTTTTKNIEHNDIGSLQLSVA